MAMEPSIEDVRARREEMRIRHVAQHSVIDAKLDSATDKLCGLHPLPEGRATVRAALVEVMDAVMLAVDLRLSRDERI